MPSGKTIGTYNWDTNRLARKFEEFKKRNIRYAVEKKVNSKMPVLDHIHTYARWMISKGKPQIRQGEPMYKCIDPDCSHVTPRSLVIGKRSKCTKCGTEIILSREDLKRVNPTCIKCSNTKEAKALASASNLLVDFNLFDSKELEAGEDRISKFHEGMKGEE